MKAIGWNIQYADEDTLDFTDLTPGTITENLNYIEEARVGAVNSVNNTKDAAIVSISEAAQADFDLMDEYVQHVNEAMVQTQAAEVELK